jgi:hypothetical protein
MFSFWSFFVKKILLGSLLILSAFNLNFAQTAKVKQPIAAKPAAAKADTPKAIEVPFVNRVLPNGLEVIVLADKSVPIATVELAVRNGSFTEPPELNGLSHPLRTYVF